MKQFFLQRLFAAVICCGCFPLNIYAQPVNDDPCGAIDLPVGVGASCQPNMSIQWTNATATPGFATPGCASYTTGDVWFRFTITNHSNVFITTSPGVGVGMISDGGMAVYSAVDCNGPFSKLICDDDGGPGSMPQVQFNALAPGTYYIRFWDYNDKTTTGFNGICVSAQPIVSNTPNDDPCSAITLDVVQADSCDPSLHPFSWEGATATQNVSAPLCGSYNSGDVWFNFTLSDTSDISIHTLAGTGIDAITDGAMALYAPGACEGSLLPLNCNNNNGADEMPLIRQYALLPGTYYIRFWDADDKITGNIGGICVAAVSPEFVIPSNDEPCGAIELPIVTDSICTPQNQLVWSYATASGGFTNPPCGSYSSGDVWFSFVLSEASDITIFSAAGSGSTATTDAAMMLYKADSCGGQFTPLLCDDDSGQGSMPQLKEYALPAGLYFLRFWDYTDRPSGNIGGICVAAKPTISMAPNDLCITAQPFPDIPQNGTCATVVAETVGATGAAQSNCGAIADDDVWYTFVVPPGIDKLGFSIEALGALSIQGIRIYTGQCGQLSSVACFNTAEGIIENLTSGQTYYLRTYTPGQGIGATYSICLSAIIAPPNDDPCGAITLPVVQGADCTPSNPFSWAFASPSAIAPPGCANYNTGDVWFTFSLDIRSDVMINTLKGIGADAIDDGGMALYAAPNDCSELLRIACTDDVSLTELMPRLEGLTLQPGEYYIRFWDFDGKITANIGGICVSAQPSASPHENELCIDAQPFPSIPSNGSCATVHINTALATGISDDPSAGGYPDDDLWYSFITPANTNRIIFQLKTISGNNQQYLCLYNECEDVAPVKCYFNEKEGVFSGLLPEKTYWIRVYTFEPGVASEFELCLKTPPPAPVNDLCVNALLFPDIPADGTCASVIVDYRWANNSLLDCSSTESGDVWYRFTVPGNVSSLLAEYTFSENDHVHPGFQLFTDNCSNLQPLGCFREDFLTSNRMYNLTPGASYLIRAFSTYNDDTDPFELCLRVPPVPPVNDRCADALPFPAIPTDGSCALVVANTLGATGDNSDACIGIFDDDVWFTFTMPQGYTSLFARQHVLSGDLSEAIAIYSGDCEHLQLVSCHTNTDTLITGLTGGQTYFVRAYSLFADETCTFEICLSTPFFTAQPNDDCVEAIPFPTVPSNGTWVTVDGNTLGATSGVLPSCNGYADDDVWFSFVVPSGATTLLFNSSVYNDYRDNGLILALYTGDCDSLQFLGCFDENESADLGDLVANQTYYLRVYTLNEHEYADFSIALSVPTPLLNDDCETAIAFPDLHTDCTTIHGNTALATGTQNPACIGTEDDDVWFKFDAPGDRTAVYFTLEKQFGASLNVSTYAGGCNNLIPMECFLLPSTDDISVLIPGKTYYIRVFTNAWNVSADFDLCLKAASPPPQNDNCVDAVSITSAPGVLIDPGLQTLQGATVSDLPVCAQFENQYLLPFDVWYSFETDEDGGEALFTFQGLEDLYDFGYFYLAMQAFSGSCGDFSSLWCGGEFSLDALTHELPLEGLEGNTRYYIRVFSNTNTLGYAPVDFNIHAGGSAFEPMSSIVDQGLPDQEGIQVVKVFPVPASETLQVVLQSEIAGNCDLRICDLTGRILESRSLDLSEGLHQESVSIRHLPAGMFTGHLQCNGRESVVFRFIKVE